MNDKILDKLDDVINNIKDSDDFKTLIDLKKNTYLQNELTKKIDRLKNIDNYSNEYVELKKEIMTDSIYKKYNTSYFNIYFLVQNINKKLKELTEDNESN